MPVPTSKAIPEAPVVEPIEVVAAPVVLIVVVGMGVYNYISAPFYMADSLRDRLDVLGNVSSDYRQGWLDCVDYYFKLAVGPTNSTTNK